jgi:hypothetical protein
MKIVKEEEKLSPDELIHSFKVDVNVEAVSEIDETVASRIINCLDEDEKKLIHYFNKPISGKVYLSYPLNVIVEVDIDECKTIGSLLSKIAKSYKNIYDTEDETQTNYQPAGSLLNRGETDGTFGIWGHVISDLYFERVSVYKNGLIELGIGS